MTYLGLDCGTSGLKAVLVGRSQRILAASLQAYAPDRPRPLWSEQDPKVWLGAMFAAIADIKAQDPDGIDKLKAIGFSGQMHGAVVLGADGQPLRPAMLHNDGRAFAEAARLHAQHPELAAIVGVKPMAGLTAPKLMWLKRHEPELYDKIRCVLLPKDYLRLALTGENMTDVSDAAGTWWLDQARRRWSPAALAASGVDPAIAPALAEGSQAVGTIRAALADQLGLPRQTIVAAGGGDTAVGAVGIGAVRPGDAYISLGTAMQFGVAAAQYRAAPEKLVHSFAHALPRRWYRMAAMLTGASALAFAARLTGSTPEELEREAARDYKGPGELIFLPYLSGERTPHDDPHARGVFFGMSPSTGRAEVARAVMEGVACALVDARDALADAQAPLTQIGLVGGGARSALWARMIACAVGSPVARYAGGETGPAFGAARLARLAATGEAAEAACAPPEVADVTAPEAGLAGAFAERVARFRDLYKALKPEFAKAGGGA